MQNDDVSHLEEALRRCPFKPGPDSMLIGYARVSTEEQNLDLQIDALLKAGVTEEMIFKEKVSATNQKRPALQECLSILRPGDTLVVWRQDRIARNLQQLLSILDEISKRGVGFVSCTEKVDTTTPIGRLYIQLVGAIAEFELQLISERTKAGVARAKERGVRFGAERIIDLDKAERLLREGRFPRDVAAQCGVSRQTVYNHFPLRERERLARLGPKKKRAAKRKP